MIAARSTRLERDRGGAEVLGLVVLAPFLVVLALVVVWVGRSVDVDARLRTAAEAGAQAGALERNHGDARLAARRAVGSMLDRDRQCASVRVEVPESARRGVGLRFGLVEVRVICELDPGRVPGRRTTRTATAWATVDMYRALVDP